jgi:hypothetical protein
MLTFLFLFDIVDIKKNSDWSSNTSSMKTSSIQEQPEVLPSGPIDLNQLLKSKNDNYLWKLVNPICFPIMMITPGFDNSVLAEQEENAPFNIVSMPITINETKANDVRKIFSFFKHCIILKYFYFFYVAALE